MNIKLEAQQGGTIHSFDVASEAPPPDVVFWDNRVFRYLRTDGVWDQKKHVYREASARTLSDSGAAFREPDCIPSPVAPRAAETPDAESEQGSRKLSLSLTDKQSALLKRARDKGGYPSNKAALVAGLEALEKGGLLSNDALLTMLAKRLRGIER